MTLTATYLDDLSRIRLAFTAAPATADYAVVERSSNQITWSTVRGGETVAITGGAGSLDDYEFAAGQLNYYRVSYVDSGPITYVTAGAPAIGVNTPLTPALPADLQAGDLLLLLVSIRGTSARPNDPDGWTLLVDAGNVGVFGRRYQPGDAAPTVTFTGDTGTDVLAQIAAWRNAELVPVTSRSQANAAAQNIAFPGLNVMGNGQLTLAAGWKQSSWSSVDTIPGTTEIAEAVSTGAGQVWDFLIETSAISVQPSALVVSGGTAAVSTGLVAAFRPADYLARDTVTITPGIDRVWLKNPRRANLNTPIGPVKRIQIERKARMGVFDVISRSLPIAVTDLRGPRQFTLAAFAETPAERDRLDLVLAAGDPILLHVPPGGPVGSLYAVVGDVTYDDEQHTFELPLTEVAAPAGTIYSQTATYADILTAYASYADVLTAEPTYSDVLDYIAPAGDVIVP